MVRFERVASSEAISSVSLLASEIWHEVYGDLLEFDHIQYMVETFQSVEAISQGEYYLLYDGDDVLGYLGVGIEDGCLLLSKIYLKKEHRGKGYLKDIMNKARQLAAYHNSFCLRLYVNKENKALHAYEALGFKNVGSVVKDIGSGYVMDDFILEFNIRR